MIRKVIKKILPGKIIVKMINYQQYIKWVLRSRPVPPPHFIKQQTIKKYAKRYRTEILVETGTYLGTMVEAQMDNFSRIYSIELDSNLASKARDKFKNFSHITILQGDSGAILPQVLKEINMPALFWLDGHYSCGITAKGNTNTPIINELSSILSHDIKNHVIIIDDARCFNGRDDYPTLESLKKFVLSRNPQLEIHIKFDGIIITPKI